MNQNITVIKKLGMTFAIALMMPVLAIAGPLGLPGLHVNAVHSLGGKALNSGTGLSVEVDFLGYGIGIGYLGGDSKSIGDVTDTDSAFLSEGTYSMIPIYGYKTWTIVPLLVDIKFGGGISINNHTVKSDEEDKIKALKTVTSYKETILPSPFLFAGVNVTPFPGVIASVAYWYHPAKTEASYGELPGGLSLSKDTYDIDLSALVLSIGYGF